MTEQAEKDLRDIFEYIAFSLVALHIAGKLLDRLENRISALFQMPERFKVYDLEPWRSRGLRTMPVDNFIVFYIPDSDRGIVAVIRILYGGRDMESALGKCPKIKYPVASIGSLCRCLFVSTLKPELLPVFLFSERRLSHGNP